MVRAREVIARIERLGGTFTRQRGSHRRYEVTFTDDEGVVRTAQTTVQVHQGREIPVGTLRAIQRDLAPAFGERWLL